MSAQSLFTNPTNGNIGLRRTIYSENQPGTLTGTGSGETTEALSVQLPEGLYMMEATLQYVLTTGSFARHLRNELYVNGVWTKTSDNFEYVTANSNGDIYGTIDSVVYVPAGQTYTIKINLNVGDLTGSVTVDYSSNPSFVVVTKIG